MAARRLALAVTAVACGVAGDGWAVTPAATAATVSSQSARLLVAASPGEVNEVSVVRDGDALVVRDAGVAPTPGTGCVAQDDGSVACPDAGVAALTVTLGDGDDGLTVLIALAGDLSGGSGNDVVSAGAASVIDGGDGADELHGTAQDDTLLGGLGDDVLVGGGGDDALLGHRGADLLVGGAGTDTVGYDDGVHDDGVAVTLSGGADDGLPLENDELREIEVVRGGAGRDSVRGTAAAETFVGGDGDDLADLGFGNDRFDGGAGADSCLLDGLDDDLCDGGPGAQDVAAYRGSLSMRISLDGVANDGRLGAVGNVVGTEEVIGGEGADFLVGSTGDDILSGRGGDDVVQGGRGDDVLSGDRGADRISGGDGRDTVSYATIFVAGPVTVVLDGLAGDGEDLENDRVGRDIEVVVGTTTAADVLGAGRAAADLRGVGGNDVLLGGPRADRFSGGPGDDRISALDGVAEVVDCGSGTDIAVVDRGDRLRGCETTGLQRVTVERPTRPQAGRLARFVVGCPEAYRSPRPSHRPRCDGTLRVGSARRSFRVRSGERRGVHLRLPLAGGFVTASARLDGLSSVSTTVRVLVADH